MAAITPTIERAPIPGGRGHLLRFSGTGTADQADSLNTGTTPTAGFHGTGGVRRVVYAACHYDDTATQAGVTFTLDSSLGTAFDVLLTTGSANAEDSVYSPDEEIWLMPGDEFHVAAPAAGAGVNASIVIVLEGV